MYRVVVLLAFVGCVLSTYPQIYPKFVPEEEVEAQPYNFNYKIVDDQGNDHRREESGDEHGNKKGSYIMYLADGRKRWVEYIADSNGFRAFVRTNEPGTKEENPADVEMTVEKVVLKPTEGPIKEPKYKILKVPVHHGYH